MKRSKEQSLFEASEIIAVIDRADLAGSLAASVGRDQQVLASLSDLCANGRTKAANQPILDAVAAKGGLLLDLWDALSDLRSSN
jgi:hypothetical protein